MALSKLVISLIAGIGSVVAVGGITAGVVVSRQNANQTVLEEETSKTNEEESNRTDSIEKRSTKEVKKQDSVTKEKANSVSIGSEQVMSEQQPKPAMDLGVTSKDVQHPKVAEKETPKTPDGMITAQQPGVGSTVASTAAPEQNLESAKGEGQNVRDEKPAAAAAEEEEEEEVTEGDSGQGTERRGDLQALSASHKEKMPAAKSNSPA